jgi:hypothetical protein
MLMVIAACVCLAGAVLAGVAMYKTRDYGGKDNA